MIRPAILGHLPPMRGTVLILIFGLLAACSPKPAAPPPEPARAAASPTAAPASPPKLLKMVCRNSQTGKSVACGTPNAVMVGMTDK